MSLDTALNYQQLLDKIEKIIPSAYAKTRNFVDGDVTYLSPYISRGVISTKQIYQSLINRGLPFYACETLLKELAWRDYFQRIWQHKNINLDIKSDQQQVTNHQIQQL
jgi:deoxyribodipyrimidine photo-lyase